MRMRMLACLILISLGFPLSGCGGGGQGGVLRSGDAIVLVGADGDDNVAGVGYSGRVGMVGNCLGISGVTFIWPHGTKVASDDPLTIDVPGLGRVKVGDQVEGGAGSWSTGHLPKGIDAIPSGCPTKEVYEFYADQ